MNFTEAHDVYILQEMLLLLQEMRNNVINSYVASSFTVNV